MGEIVRRHLALLPACRRRSLRRRAFLPRYRPARARPRTGCRPDTRIAVGLELDADLDLVAAGRAGPGLRRLRLVERAFEVLDMVADLMGDDIGLGEIARRAEPPRQFVEEGRVDVDLLVGRAIKWPHRRLRRTAARLVMVGVGDQPRRLIFAPACWKIWPQTCSVEPAPGMNCACRGVERRLPG